MPQGTVEKVAVVIFSPSSQPLERFMFDVSKFPVVPVSEVLIPFDVASPSDATARSATSLVDLEEQFRAVLKKLSYCGSTLGKLPENCSFTVCIELRDQANPPIGVRK